MRIVAAVAALSLLVPGVAHAGAPFWELKPTGTDARLRGLSAVSHDTAWVSGSKGTVLRTTDGGRSWKSVPPPDTATLDFRDIEAFDARTAVALSIGEGEASRIYRTDDGGRSWREAFRNTDPKAFYDCVAFFDRHRGIALSDPVDGKFRVLSTRDGGRSWKVNDTKGMPDALADEFAFAASGQCVTTSGNHAWIATGGGAKARVLHSKDGGRSWEASETPLPSGAAAGVFAVAFKNPWQGAAIGGDYLKPDDPTPAFALSNGRTWKSTAEAPVGYRSGLTYRHQGLVAVGPTGTDISRDGQRWKKVDDGSFDTVDCARTCWAAGEKGRVGRLS